MSLSKDQEILRRLAARYAAIAALPIQEEKRALWTDHFSRKRTRLAILATYGTWNVWCREVFGDARMGCEVAVGAWMSPPRSMPSTPAAAQVCGM